MSSFKKISKEEWLKLSQEEKDYLTLQFNQSVESRKKTTLFVTRSIAIFCVLALIFIGYSYLQLSLSYGQIKDKYGPEASCYLCGYENMKQCSCIHLKGKINNITSFRENLAEGNIKKCVETAEKTEFDMNDLNFTFSS